MEENKVEEIVFEEAIDDVKVEESTTKEETKEVNIDVTATTDSPKVVDERQHPQDSLKVDVTTTEVKNNLDIRVAEQSKQLEEMKKELDALKVSNKELNEQKEKLEKDISSLRENPFYNASKNINGLNTKNTTEYSVEDIRNMRKGI